MLAIPIMIVLVVIVSGFVCCVLWWLLFNRLVKIEYKRHRDRWVYDGKPWPSIIRGPDGGNIVAWYVCFWAWLFVTPPWVKQDKAAIWLLRCVRLFVCLFILILLVGYLVSNRYESST